MTQTLLRDAPPLGDRVSTTATDDGAPSRPTAEPQAHRSAWHAIKKITSVVAGAFLTVVAVLTIVVGVSSHFSSNGQPGLFGHPVMSVLSGSMAPKINTGDLVIDDAVTPVEAAHLNVGQIITFRSAANSHQIFTHRIAGVQTSPSGAVAYVTKGDANDSQDGPLASSTNVLGVYQSKVPDGGYVLNALHRPLILGLLLAAPILWLFSEPVWNWVRQVDEPVEGSAPRS